MKVHKSGSYISHHTTLSSDHFDLLNFTPRVCNAGDNPQRSSSSEATEDVKFVFFLESNLARNETEQCFLSKVEINSSDQ